MAAPEGLAFGALLKRYRLAAGLSREALADQSADAEVLAEQHRRLTVGRPAEIGPGTSQRSLPADHIDAIGRVTPATPVLAISRIRSPF